MPSGTVVSTPASGSSNPVPKTQCPSRRCGAVRASYTVSSCAIALPRDGTAPSRGPPPRGTSGGGEEGVLSDVGDVLGDVVERRVPVDLVATGGEHRVLLVGARR